MVSGQFLQPLIRSIRDNDPQVQGWSLSSYNYDDHQQIMGDVTDKDSFAQLWQDSHPLNELTAIRTDNVVERIFGGADMHNNRTTFMIFVSANSTLDLRKFIENDRQYFVILNGAISEFKCSVFHMFLHGLPYPPPPPPPPPGKPNNRIVDKVWQNCSTYSYLVWERDCIAQQRPDIIANYKGNRRYDNAELHEGGILYKWNGHAPVDLIDMFTE